MSTQKVERKSAEHRLQKAITPLTAKLRDTWQKTVNARVATE
jgi:hypothetical protein